MYESNRDSNFPSDLFSKCFTHIGYQIPRYSELLPAASFCFESLHQKAFWLKGNTFVLEVDSIGRRNCVQCVAFTIDLVEKKKVSKVQNAEFLLLCSHVLLMRKIETTSYSVFINIYLFFRVYCPRNCMQANPHYARVIGTRVYSDVSILIYAALSICV